MSDRIQGQGLDLDVLTELRESREDHLEGTVGEHHENGHEFTLPVGRRRPYA